MSSELAIIGQEPTAIAPSGLGYTGTNSKLFDLTPATLGIVQPNSTLDDAKKGHFIIDGDTSLQFKEMRVTLLQQPTEQRAYYIGEAGTMNRTPDNLHCFCRNIDVANPMPDPKAKYPQAQTCKSCPKQSWEQFRAKRDKGIQTTKEDIPPCDSFYYAMLIDTEYKMPLQLYVRSTSREPFEKGMKSLARKLAIISATSKKTPNIFDVSFKLTTKLVEKGKFKFYILNLSDFEGIEDEQRIEFGAVFNQIADQQVRRAERLLAASSEEAEQAAVAQAETSIDSAVLEGDYVEDASGEIKL